MKMKLRSQWLNELSWQDVEEYLKEEDMIIIPIGSTEQHGPGGLLGQDTYAAIAIAGDAAKRGGILTTPPMWFGDCPHHLGFPGTISLKSSTVVSVLKDMVHSLAKNGFKKFIFVNGHKGTNIAPITIASRELMEYELPHVRIALADPGYLADRADEIKKEFIGDVVEHHAGTLEISHVLYNFPEVSIPEKFPSEYPDLEEEFGPEGYMRKDLYGDAHPPVELYWNSEQQKRFAPKGNFSPCDKASKELGKAYHDNMVNNLVDFIAWFKKYEG
jgi:creatinine amidohydrolase